MKKRIIILSFAVLFLVAFALFSKYEDRDFFRQLDFAVTVKLQEYIDTSTRLRTVALVGNVMEGATFFASPELTVVVTLLLTAACIYDRKKRRWHLLAVAIPIALVLIVALEIYGKSVVHHPAPPFSMIKHPTTIFPADYINEQFSYPSGHTARAIFLGLVFLSPLLTRSTWFRLKKRDIFRTLGIVGYVCIVSMSRIYLGHHWFSDVVGGLLLGSSMGLFAMSFGDMKENVGSQSDPLPPRGGKTASYDAHAHHTPKRMVKE